MNEPYRRRLRFLVIFLVLILGVYFFSQRFERKAKANPLEKISYQVVQIVAKPFRAISHFFSQRYTDYIALWGVRQENQALQREVLKLRQMLVRSQENFLQRERELANFQKLDLKNFKTIPAQVVAYDPNPQRRSLTINVGSEQGLRLQDTVVASGGLVGRVVELNPRFAQVLLIQDLKSSVDIVDQRTRARGTLVGLRRTLSLHRDFWLTQAEYISKKEEIGEGDVLLTSGQDGIFPKGIPVGTVEKLSQDEQGFFWKAEVIPWVELGNLEEVLVVVTP